MKSTFAILAVLLMSTAANAETPRLILKCKGYTLSVPQVPEEHAVAIYTTFAEVDGERYSLSETATEFDLKKPGSDIEFDISRLNGDFVFGPTKKTTGKVVYNGVGEKGCEKAIQVF